MLASKECETLQRTLGQIPLMTEHLCPAVGYKGVDDYILNYKVDTEFLRNIR